MSKGQSNYTMKTVCKWDFEKHEYHDAEIADTACTYSDDMDKVVTCASCGKKMLFGNGYTSRQYHTPYGIGYTVCQDCYNKEWQQEVSNMKKGEKDE